MARSTRKVRWNRRHQHRTARVHHDFTSAQVAALREARCGCACRETADDSTLQRDYVRAEKTRRKEPDEATLLLRRHTVVQDLARAGGTGEVGRA